MPLLKGSSEIYIIYKENKFECELYYETDNRIGFLVKNFPEINKLKSEIRLDFEAKQGNYECNFQSKMEFIEFDYLNQKYLLEIETPALLRRVLKA